MLLRRLVVQRRVHSRSIVEAFDVVEDLQPGLFSSFEVTVIERFGLDRTEEALGDRVVAALPWTAHTATHAVAFELLFVLVAAILRPSIRVVDQPRLGLSRLIGRGEGF